jgi:hypothetical protein
MASALQDQPAPGGRTNARTRSAPTPPGDAASRPATAPVLAGLHVLAGVAFLAGAVMLLASPSFSSILGAVFFLLFAVGAAVIARGLWNAQLWAWGVAVAVNAFSVLGTIGAWSDLDRDLSPVAGPAVLAFNGVTLVALAAAFPAYRAVDAARNA